MTKIIRIKLKIEGNVQGVWYRKSAQEHAQFLGVTGFVQNEADGSVYAEAQGKEELVDQMITWCQDGPPFCAVEKITVETIELVDEDIFEIRRS